MNTERKRSWGVRLAAKQEKGKTEGARKRDFRRVVEGGVRKVEKCANLPNLSLLGEAL